MADQKAAGPPAAAGNLSFHDCFLGDGAAAAGGGQQQAQAADPFPAPKPIAHPDAFYDDGAEQGLPQPKKAPASPPAARPHPDDFYEGGGDAPPPVFPERMLGRAPSGPSKPHPYDSFMDD